MTKNTMTFTKSGGKNPFKVKDVVLNASQVLTDNTLIKKAHVELEYTPEQSVELYRCRKDPVYFIENYTRIISVDDGLVPFKMYPYQKKMVEMYAKNKRCITATLRQAGKCVFASTTVTIFKDGQRKDVPISEVFDSGDYIADLSDDKFVQMSATKDVLVLSDKGFVPMVAAYKTIPYKVFELTTTDGLKLECADDHIVFDSEYNEVFIKDLSNGDLIVTESGLSTVSSVIETGRLEKMYDLQVESPDHRYYTNGILSHNTTVVAAFLLWYAIFHDEKEIAVLANKGAQAQEIMDRIRLMAENLPYFVMRGVKVFNKATLVFDNDSKIFGAASGSSSIRGKSCVVGDTLVDIEGLGKVRIDSLLKDNSIRDIDGRRMYPVHNMKAMTPTGYRSFEGILETPKADTIILYSGLECTPDHLVLRDGKFVEAKTLPHFKGRSNVSVYDLYDVDGRAYITGNDVSHNCALLYLDEMAFLAQDEDFWTSTMPVVSSGKDSRIIITSTPNGQRGVFYRVYQEAVSGVNGYAYMTATWRDHPKRDAEWANRTRAEIGTSRFQQEFEVSFMGSSGTLIPADILAGLQFLNPVSESEHLKIYKPVVEGRRYVMTVDCAEGLGQDSSTATVFDVTESKFEQVAVYRNNTVSPILYPHVIMQLAMNYNNCPVIVEANNDVGGQVSYILYYELEYENVVLFKSDDKRGQREGGRRSTPGVKMNKKIKAMGCASLKTLLETGVLILNDMETIAELGTFVAKGNSYEADDGTHDDLVMNLVLFAWFAKQDWFTDYCGNDLGNMIFEQEKERMFESLLPVGFRSTYTPQQETYNGTGYNVTVGSASGLEAWMKE